MRDQQRNNSFWWGLQFFLLAMPTFRVNMKASGRKLESSLPDGRCSNLYQMISAIRCSQEVAESPR